MSWKDRLRPASFRNVPFKVETMGGAGGRRQIVTEYPKRDTPHTEDMGRKSRSYTMNAYVIGQDYETLRDNLIAALEVKGAATLIHPTIGNISVVSGDFSYEESRDEGGMCRFTLTFFESGENLYPAATSDTQSGVATAADDAKKGLAASFSDNFNVTSVPDFVTASAAEKLSDLAALLGGLRSGGAVGSDVLATRDSAAARLGDILDDPVGYILGDVPSLIASMLSDFRLTAGSSAGLAGLRDVATYGGGLEPVAASTPSRAIEAANTTALSALIQGAALTEQALLSASMSFSSYDDAAALRDALTTDLGEAAVAAADRGDDTGFRSLRGLSAAVSADLTARGASLARLKNYERPAVVPAALLAYQLYGDASRADELVARNAVPHPLFMPLKGQALAS